MNPTTVCERVVSDKDIFWKSEPVLTRTQFVGRHCELGNLAGKQEWRSKNNTQPLEMGGTIAWG